MMETVLLVGGSADGKRCAKDNTRDYIDIPVMEEYEARWINSPGQPKLMLERYNRTTLTNGKQDFYVFLSASESPDNLIPLLIEGYKRTGIRSIPRKDY